MKKKYTLLVFSVFLLVAASLAAQTWRKWEFINPADVQITIVPEKLEITAGAIATFTISIRNRTDKTVQIHYPTGQQWDLAAYHDGTQIYRWSQGLVWAESPHTVPIKAGESRSEKLAWETVDRLGLPLPHGIYRIHGMVMTVPRYLVSNNCSIRLLPDDVKKEEEIKVRLNQLFDVELPRYSGNRELEWKINYKYNDNRIAVNRIAKKGDKLCVTFHPKRVGHVMFDLYAYHDTQDESKSLERRSFRVEVE
ncbi:MAG: BsuPI-related putative proteinase inhibitor [Candidatus Riflebacteria bacterium]|nr:BsuPI-related putative proteinase inhibitor [Candidatus Riflebacteria bacterium]